MGSFTWEIKRGLLSAPPKSACCKIAQCAAYLRTNGSLSENSFSFVSENERIAEYFVQMFEWAYGAQLQLKGAVTDPKRARDKLTFTYGGAGAKRILRDIGAGAEGIPERFSAKDCCALAYIEGVFLGSGSCTLPGGNGKTGYHLEFVFPTVPLAEDFCALLASFELLAKLVKRGERAVVYLKSRDELSDFFSLIGAQNALKRLNAVSGAREESNQENRVNNCFVGNTDRTAAASAEQTLAIVEIEKQIGLGSLDRPLRDLARARLAYPMESLRSLGDRLGESKSCLNHRMRKLMEIYNQLEK